MLEPGQGEVPLSPRRCSRSRGAAQRLGPGSVLGQTLPEAGAGSEVAEPRQARLSKPLGLLRSLLTTHRKSKPAPAKGALSLRPSAASCERRREDHQATGGQDGEQHRQQDPGPGLPSENQVKRKECICLAQGVWHLTTELFCAAPPHPHCWPNAFSAMLTPRVTAPSPAPPFPQVLTFLPVSLACRLPSSLVLRPFCFIKSREGPGHLGAGLRFRPSRNFGGTASTTPQGFGRPNSTHVRCYSSRRSGKGKRFSLSSSRRDGLTGPGRKEPTPRRRHCSRRHSC